MGKVLVNDTEDKNLVQDLMTLKARLDRVVRDCYADDKKFVQGEKDAFAFFINTRPNKTAELIAKFMDSKLRLGNKECTDERLEEIMEDVIVLFRFIQGKPIEGLVHAVLVFREGRFRGVLQEGAGQTTANGPKRFRGRREADAVQAEER